MSESRACETHTERLLENISKAKHKYCGILDENGFRTGKGCQQWCKEGYIQKYLGQFFYNNLQNKGVYFIEKKGDQTYYDGCFYSNKLEGYGKVVYVDNKIFEGLFKQHVRFGPGVLTYSNNTQDAGLWDGFVLRRIIVSIGKDFVPRLGRTLTGKAKLLKFRELVPVCDKIEDRTRKILEDLNAEKETLSQSNELYNLHIRNCESLFFNTSLFHENFTNEDCTIEVIISQDQFENGKLESKYSFHEQKNQSQSDDNSLCTCFQVNIDKFGQLCDQLLDVEVKLRTTLSKRTRIEKHLNTCKQCYQNMQLIAKKPDPTNVAELKKILSILHTAGIKNSNKTDSQKILSFYSDISDVQNIESEKDVIKSEIELKNYLYTHSTVMTNDSDEAQQQIKFSKTTLPFSHFSTSHSGDTKFAEKLNYDLLTEDACEESTMDFMHVPSVCYCSEMLIENIDIIQEKLKSLMQEELFYTTVRNMLKKQLDTEFQKMTQLVEEDVRFIKKVQVTHLLAWNNEEVWISMLQHCFRHRLSEDNVNFSVRELLTGHRNHFTNPGVHETNCRKFLEECGNGNDENIANYVSVSHINPDLCDVKGNTGLMLATIKDKINIITTLINYGAKLDVMNDEGLTPLTMSFLKYISIAFNVYDWEKAFMPESNSIDINVHQWHSAESHSDIYDKLINDERHSHGKQQSLNSQPNIEMNSKVLMTSENLQKEQKYIFNMEFIRLLTKKTTNKKTRKQYKKRNIDKENVKGKIKTQDLYNSKNKKRKIKAEVENKSNFTEETYKSKLDTIKKTIITLLNYDSDPNIGIVPLQPIFLAIFTDDSDFMHGLLKNNANPNAVTYEYNLTSLQVIVSLKLSLEKVKMCDYLLQYKADSNIKCNVNHWQELKKEVLGDCFDDIPNEGKNVLHMLSLREDYINDVDNFFGLIANLLIFNKCNTTEFYLGHTPLSLAVLRGNTNLIKTFLSSKRVDPHQLLGNKMGNALTVLILNRYSSVLNAELKRNVAETLIENGLNPLNNIGVFENVINFMENEYEDSERKVSPGKLKNYNKKSFKTSKRSPHMSSKNVLVKSGGDFSKVKLISLENYISEVSKYFLFRHLQGKAVFYLYTFIKEELFEPILVTLAKFVTPDKALAILKLLFQYGILDNEQYCVSTICNFFHFIKSQHLLEQEQGSTECQSIMEILKSNDTWTKIEEESESIYLPIPEVDKHIAKYKICFNCLKSKGKTLVKCPHCELVYFCSEECNLVDNKLSQYHNCNRQDQFYYRAQNDVPSSRLSILLEMAKQLDNERKIFRQLKELNDKVLKLKLITNKSKQEMAALFQLLKRSMKERKYFADTNKIYTNKLIFVHDHQHDDKANPEEHNIINFTNMALLSNHLDLKEPLLLIYGSISQFASNLFLVNSTAPAIQATCNYQINLSTSTSRRSTSKTKAALSGISSSVGKISGKPNVYSTTPANTALPLQLFSTSQKSRQISHLLPAKEYSVTKRSFPVSKQFEDNFITKLGQEQSSGNIAESIEKTKKSVGKLYCTELLSKIFSDFNLPLLLLPYACFKDGQIYYSTSGNNGFSSGFYQLNIPD